jgi:hypothetical protein
MWLMAMSLTLAGLALLGFRARGGRGAHHADLGWMSQQWLAEHRAGSR